MKSIRLKFFCFIIGTIVYLVLFYNFIEKYPTVKKETYVKLNHVVVHMDLKGAPPKLKYLESLLPMFKKYGVNGILMEYEDMFPYSGNLVNLSSRNRYDRAKLKKFLVKAVELQIEIIPLIQTFGHMEHALKLQEFKHLREVEIYPDSICPSNNESVELVKEMLKQVIHFHASVTPLKHIHIGCDEVYHLNTCDKCSARMIKYDKDLFLMHMLALKELLFRLSPETKVLIWDDMFRSISKPRWHAQTMAKFKELEPVYWDYSQELSVTHLTLHYYHKTFKNIWIASAFKGADGLQAILPDIKHRFLNHFSWMCLIFNYMFSGEKKVYNFGGIILTGWSRYSHMDPLCELLPAAIPSLVLNLLLVQKFRNNVTFSNTLKPPSKSFVDFILSELYHDLQCKNAELDIENLASYIDSCSFQSNDLYTLLKQYKLLETNVNDAFSNDKSALSSIEYYIKIKNVNMNTINSSRDWCYFTLRELNDWAKTMSKVMSEYYDNFVIEEYVGHKMYTIKSRVKNTMKMLDDYLRMRSWDRRPYNMSNMFN